MEKNTKKRPRRDSDETSVERRSRINREREKKEERQYQKFVKKFPTKKALELYTGGTNKRILRKRPSHPRLLQSFEGLTSHASLYEEHGPFGSCAFNDSSLRRILKNEKIATEMTIIIFDLFSTTTTTTTTREFSIEEKQEIRKIVHQYHENFSLYRYWNCYFTLLKDPSSPICQENFSIAQQGPSTLYNLLLVEYHKNSESIAISRLLKKVTFISKMIPSAFRYIKKVEVIDGARNFLRYVNNSIVVVAASIIHNIDLFSSILNMFIELNGILCLEKYCNEWILNGCFTRLPVYQYGEFNDKWEFVDKSVSHNDEIMSSSCDSDCSECDHDNDTKFSSPIIKGNAKLVLQNIKKGRVLKNVFRISRIASIFFK